MAGQTTRSARQLGGLGVLRGIRDGAAEEARTRGFAAPAFAGCAFVEGSWLSYGVVRELSSDQRLRRANPHQLERCHSERSDESRLGNGEILRCAQDDVYSLRTACSGSNLQSPAQRRIHLAPPKHCRTQSFPLPGSVSEPAV